MRKGFGFFCGAAVASVVVFAFQGFAQDNAQNATETKPAENAAPAAPAAGGVPTLASLLSDAGFAFSQPDKSVPTYRVTVEASNEVSVVIARERDASWNGPDGKPVKYVQLYANISPTYEKDVEPSAKLLRTIAEETDNNIFVSCSIFTDQQTQKWTIYSNAYFFLRGSDKQEASDYLYLVHNGTIAAKKKFLPLVEQKTAAGPMP
jgi:hypothetical protein